MSFLPEEYEKYLAPETDRLSFLRDYLALRGVETCVIPLAGKKHLYVNFPSSSYISYWSI